MKKLFIVIPLIVGLSLIGCGGGGGESSTPTPAPIPGNPSTNPTPITPIVGVEIKNISYVQGIYDISTLDDIVYLSIDKDGSINTYDYQGDTKDKGLNCYKINPTPDYNDSINGSVLVNDEANKKFTINGGISWNYGDKQSISSVSYNGITARKTLTINNLRIATSEFLTTAVTLDEIKQSICK